MRITDPGPTVRQISALGPDGQWVLSVLAKRTYRLLDSGRCALADQQLPLQEEILADPQDPELVVADSDLYPCKLFTDVVVRGSAKARGLCRQMEVTVRVAGAAKSLAVLGARRASLSSTGQVIFSEAGTLDQVPLRYDQAYGGRDAVAEARYGNPAEQYKDLLPENFNVKELSPYRYPRNPCGKGYVIDASREALESLELPRLEDPLDRLTPERLPLGRPGAWPRMPLPAAFDWVQLGWFPRVAYLGVLPMFDPIEGPVAEVTRGFAPADVLQDRMIQDKFDLRMASGASLGLQLPDLRGNEECLLQNIHPRQSSFVLRLPGDRPRISVDGRKGTLKSTDPVLHTVLIEPDEERVSVVWRGAAPALRPYLPEELPRMPLLVEWS
jgi:hypothetical protein